MGRLPLRSSPLVSYLVNRMDYVTEIYRVLYSTRAAILSFPVNEMRKARYANRVPARFCTGIE